jgi:acetoin utilization deacetylase AcuC-like enzyme
MRVLLITHAASLDHDNGWGHPERPERIEAVTDGVRASGLEVADADAPRAARDDLELVHDAAYIDMIEKACRDGGLRLDPDTRVVPGSWEAALRSAGAGVLAAAALREGGADVAYIATRPPGHHALAARAMGFCIFNNIAVAAARLTSAGERVAIVDWDVHHGNGTQDAFYDDPRVLYVSVHEDRFYPGTGAASERGARDGLGTTINLPLPAGSDGPVYRWLFGQVVIPAVSRFRPDWLLVSCGYDAHSADPLADMRLEADDYGQLAAGLAAVVPAARTIFFLEGGYDLEALRASAAATLAGQASGVADPVEPEDGLSRHWRAAFTLAGRASQEGQDG